MEEEDFRSLVEALTPRVVDAGRQRLQASTTSTPTTSTSQPPLTSQRQFPLTQPSTSGWKPRCTPKEELRRAFRRRQHVPYKKKELGSKCIDVILLPDHEWSKVVRGKERAQFHQEGLLVDTFRFEKSWSEGQVFDALFNAFRNQLTTASGESVTFCLKKPEGVVLLQPRIAPTETLSGEKICEIFSQKTVYLCPDRDLQVFKKEIISSDEDDKLEDDRADETPLFGESSKSTYSESSSSRKQPSATFVCERCTYINPSSVTECQMCSEDPLVEQSSPTNMQMPVMPPLLQAPSKPKDGSRMIKDILGFDNNPSLTLYVDRDTLLDDNIAFFKKKFKIENPIKVKFHGEMAVDAGGPLRENFRLLVRRLYSSDLNLFFGTQSHNLLPSNNQMLLYSGMFEVLGKIIAAAFVHGIPMNLPLHPAVIGCLLDRPKEEIFGHLQLNDILDLELQDMLRQILECDQDDDLLTLVTKEGGATHWLDSCGWPASKKMTVTCKHDLVLCVMHHYIIGIRSAAISSIQKGMKCEDKFPLALLSASEFSKLLTPQQITAA
ncbi:uncharacterized protein [Apostichopus japonicus]|uniref:uncharacterized protein n=1 Tax=Stichopus japonicus TaxID=307972 RepID=UPI003AB47976